MTGGIREGPSWRLVTKHGPMPAKTLNGLPFDPDALSAGLSMTPGFVYGAANSSILDWEHQMRSSLPGPFDQAATRACAIGRARKMNKANVELRFEFNSLSPEVFIEVKLVQDMIVTWSENEEALIKKQRPELSAFWPKDFVNLQVSAPADDGNTSSGRRASKRQAARHPQSTAQQEPPYKRAKTIGSGSKGKGKERALDESGANSPSAAERVLEVFELCTLILRPLAFDRIDLLAFSCVSKRARAVTLPLLVQALNVPLTKAHHVHALLAAYPGLVENVKFLRIYDEIALDLSVYAADVDDKPACLSKNGPKKTAATWKSLGQLLQIVRDRRVQPTPKLELTFGQHHLRELATLLKRNKVLLQQLVGLHIVNDAEVEMLPPNFKTSAEIRSVYRLHAQVVSQYLLDIINLSAHDTFRIFDFEPFDFGNGCLDTFFLSDDLLDALSTRVRDFRMNLVRVAEFDTARWDNFLRTAHWPQLQRIHWVYDDEPDEYGGELFRSIPTFLQRHESLSDVTIDMMMEHQCSLDGVDLPKLRRFAVHEEQWFEHDTVHAFLQRHSGVKELFLWPDDGPSVPAHLLKQLQVLKATPYYIERLLLRCPSLRHVELLGDGLPPLSPALLFPSVTCWHSDFTSTHLTLGAFVYALDDGMPPLSTLPNLTELAFTVEKESWAEKHSSSYEGRSNQALDLAVLLAKLSPHPKLCTLHVGITQSRIQPDENDLNAVLTTLPPSLRYLCLRTSYSPKTAIFRVVRPPSNAQPTPVQSAASEARPRGGPSKGKGKAKQSQAAAIVNKSRPHFQRLPESVHEWVDRATGTWRTDRKDSLPHFLHDHTGDGSALLHL